MYLEALKSHETYYSKFISYDHIIWTNVGIKDYLRLIVQVFAQKG